LRRRENREADPIIESSQQSPVVHLPVRKRTRVCESGRARTCARPIAFGYLFDGASFEPHAIGCDFGKGIACVSGCKNQMRREAMAYFERMRDVISGPFSPEVIRQRAAAGWQMVSIEWRRELPDAEAPAEGAFNEDIPYGLRISDDCKRLEPDPAEHSVLMQMMELLVQEFSYSSIVSDLNEKGFRMRDGRPWSRVAVFNMIPRLIEVGPRFFGSEEWEQRRQSFAHAKAPDVD
jgi:hypothetical protein